MMCMGCVFKLVDYVFELFVDLYLYDVLLVGVCEGGLVCVLLCWGSVVVCVCMMGGIVCGSVFVLIYWNGQFVFDVCVGVVVNLVVDLVFGELEFKYILVMVELFDVVWYGFVFLCCVFDIDDVMWWMCI